MLKEGGIFLSSRFSSEISNYFRAGSENFSSLFKFDRLDLSIDFLPFEPAIVVPPVPDTEVTSGRKIIPLVDANEILKGDDEQALPGPGEPVNPSKDVISLYDSRDDFKFLAVGEADAGKVLSVISDDNKGSDAAIVTVTLNGRSDVFKANDDVLNVGGGLGGGWLNDDTETDPMKLFSTPGHGGADVYAGNEFAHESSDLVAVNASGSWVYDPGVRVDGILVGQSSVSEFDYFADDGGFEGAMVLVKALAQNAAPVASDDDFTTDENTSINGNLFIFNGVGFDQDADAGDSFSLTALNGDALSVGQQVILPSGALLLLAVDGSFSYDPNGQFESLGVGETTTDIFNYTISDSNGASSAATVTIAIVGVNDVPVALDDEYSLVEDEQILDGTIFRDVGGIGDFDFDINDNLSVVSVNGSEASIGKEVVLASGALLTLNADGTFVYNTNGKFAALDTGQAFVEEFTYAITDGQLDQVAATFDPDILPSSLDGTAGYTINGNGFQFGSGRVVSSAGDFNADGVDDFLISAANQVSVVFGQSGESVVDFELSDLNGVNGFKINAIERFDQFGRSISSAGDMNGDGFDDIIIGAGFADGAFSGAGESYVVFGTSTPFLPTFDLTDLDGTNGFVLDGSVFNGQSGIAVANIGDLNGDGLQDIAVSAPFAGVGGETAGQIYIVYGRLDPFPARFSVSELDGANGFTINGIDNRDNIGNTKDSISGAGDVNGDGVDDMLVGAIFGGSPLNSGESYIVFGATGDRSASLFLSDLNGTNGYTLSGSVENERSGYAVAGIGDVNGDGIDDFAIGAPDSFVTGDRIGKVYVVFGADAGVASDIVLSTLNGTNGFIINGINRFDEIGTSLSSAGDINGDGLDDILIGAPNADKNNQTNSGQAYVVFGSTDAFESSLSLVDLDGVNGFSISGLNTQDFVGISVSSVGDVNGDGFDDLIVGASGADPNEDRSGETYIIFGRADFVPVQSNVATVEITINGKNNITITGTPGNDTLTGGADGEDIFGLAGADIISGGGGNDIIDGSSGSDIIQGNEGEDVITGGSGRDFIEGGEGDDVLTGNGSRDTVSGGDGDDTIDGGADRDTIDGGDGNDNLTGGDGADRIFGGDGNDIISGRRGSDTISAGDGDDIVAGRGLTDMISGGAGNDILRGNGGNDTLNGDAGDDLIVGGQGNDILSGGSGDDRLDGRAGNDTLSGGSGSDILTGKSGNDTFIFSAGHEQVEITDLRDGEDTLDLTSYGFGTFSEAAALMIELNGDVVFTSGDDTLTLRNVTIAALEGDILI